MERKEHFILPDTEDLLATQKVPCTQDLEDTLLVDATQCEENTQIEEDLSIEGSQSTESLLEKEEIEKHKDNGNPLKDVSNLPKNANLRKHLRSDLPNDSDNHKSVAQCTKDLPDTEEIMPSQPNTSILEESDLTPEMPEIDASDPKNAGLKEKVEKLGGVSVSQSSTSSGNPESSSSGSHPTSSQLSSSDNSISSSQQTDSSTPKQKIAEDSGVSKVFTQDLFLTQETTLDETVTCSQEYAKKKSQSISPILAPVPTGQNEDKTENTPEFKVPLKTSPGAKELSRERRYSREKLRRRGMSVFAKTSPTLDSQDVTLRMSGSGSETDGISPDDLDGELTKMQVDYLTPESGVKITPENKLRSAQFKKTPADEQRETVELNQNLLVRSTNLVECKINADPNTGEVISLQIFNIESLATDVKQTIEPSWYGTPVDPHPTQRIGTAGGGRSKDVSQGDAWKVTLSSSFLESLQSTLSASFMKEISRRNYLVKTKTREQSVTPVMSKTNPRKRKLSSSSPANDGSFINGNDSTKKISPATASPFKRPRLRRLSTGGEKTPKKKHPSPNLTLPLKEPLDTSMSSANYLMEGAKVFARWGDKIYYPADVVKRIVTSGHYLVRFHDKREKELPGNSICAVNTFEINQPVLALTSTFYKKGKVVQVKAFDFMDEEYVVKLDQDGTLLELPRDKLSMTEQMVQFYKQRDCTSDAAPRVQFESVSLENLLHGKRTRSTISPCPIASTSTLKSGSGPKPRVTTPESSSCDETEKPESCLRITGIEPEENNPDPLAGKGPKKTKGRKKASPEDESLLNEFGPIPEEGSELFSGLTFILTCAIKHEHDKGRNNGNALTADTDSFSETECFCEAFTKINKTMSKSRLTEQITAGGGRVVTDLDDFLRKLGAQPNFDNVFLIANRPCQTAVFIHCVALGIKGVLFDAVIHCCKKGLNFKEYFNQCQTILDVGFSIKERRLVAWNEFKDKTFKQSLESNGVLVHSKNKAFVKYWEKVLRCAGAPVLKLHSVEDMNFVSVVVAERPVSSFVKDTARQFCIPIVSVNWIIQSLIHQEALPLDWHQDFRVELDDSD